MTVPEHAPLLVGLTVAAIAFGILAGTIIGNAIDGRRK